MSFDYINRSYGLNAQRGMRVRYTGGKEPQIGTVTSAEGAHLMIRLDGQRHAMPYHPTWKLEFLDGAH